MTYEQARHELTTLTTDYYAGLMDYATYCERHAAIRSAAGYGR